MHPSNNVVSYILIVDDDPDDHYFLRRALTDAVPQVLVESVYDGSEALQYLHSCPSLPSLIFLDLNMTRITGKDTMKVIRDNPVLNKVPVVILTTSRNNAEKEELLNLGAVGFYNKPHSSAELTEMILEVKRTWLQVPV
jgi:CheY-like chemotaxis protein